MSGSTQGQNKPNHGRVTIAYETDGDKSKNPSIPWVMGVMADLSGSNSAPEDFDERRFSEITDSNFDDYLESQKPAISEKVENKLDGEGQLQVDLEFESIDDFAPDRIAEKMDSTAQLLEKRDRIQQAIRDADGTKLGKIMGTTLGKLLEAEEKGAGE